MRINDEGYRHQANTSWDVDNCTRNGHKAQIAIVAALRTVRHWVVFGTLVSTMVHICVLYPTRRSQDTASKPSVLKSQGVQPEGWP